MDRIDTSIALAGLAIAITAGALKALQVRLPRWLLWLGMAAGVSLIVIALVIAILPSNPKPSVAAVVPTPTRMGPPSAPVSQIVVPTPKPTLTRRHYPARSRRRPTASQQQGPATQPPTTVQKCVITGGTNNGVQVQNCSD